MNAKVGLIIGIAALLLLIYIATRIMQRRRERQWLIAANNLVQPVLRLLGLEPVGGHPVDKVWGHTLALISYRVPNPNGLTEQQVRSAFKQVPASKLQLTDLWLREGDIHIDVALMVNMSTKGYVDDLHKL